jgi:hypothetical protein
LRRHERLQLDFPFYQFEVGESQRSRAARYRPGAFLLWGEASSSDVQLTDRDQAI